MAVATAAVAAVAAAISSSCVAEVPTPRFRALSSLLAASLSSKASSDAMADDARRAAGEGGVKACDCCTYWGKNQASSEKQR